MRGPAPEPTMFNPGQLGPYSHVQQMGGGVGVGPSTSLNGEASALSWQHCSLASQPLHPWKEGLASLV